MTARRFLTIGSLVLVFVGLTVTAYGFATVIACLCVEGQQCPPCTDYWIEAIRIAGILFIVGGIALLGFLVRRERQKPQ